MAVKSNLCAIVLVILLVAVPVDVAQCIPVDGLLMVPDGTVVLDASYTYIFRNVTVEDEEVYAKSSRVLFKGGFAAANDLNIFAGAGISNFSDDNLDSDYGFTYLLGARIHRVYPHPGIKTLNPTRDQLLPNQFFFEVYF